ncbi:amidase [Isoptericola dokdonensis]|uniref:Acylamidase n=1 Tax=Isoptericola dokdonensis DS-3 TaxID=1300344 RepID=A0A161HQV2_9MICO|nr:amidase [Isoptericola dokdonensis]ANC31592.1 Acylamidase [Isoptericola dokdonensis DS-3]
MDALHEQTAVELRDRLRAGEVTPSEVTDHFLARIERRNAELGAFSLVTPDAARERAASLDAAPHGTLWGLPSGDKDLWARAGVPTGFGSRALAGFVPEVSDDVVDDLDDAGLVSLGRTTAPELGFPAYTEPLAGPVARNPWDTSRGAGGSSGGAAVAVAAGLLPFAPGSDGGGSVRIPAAACGVVGLKPSRGLLPSGSGQEAPGGLVVNGPLARTTADAALLLEGMIRRRPDGAAAHRFTLRAPVAHAGAYLAAAQRGEVAGRDDDGGRFRLGVTTWSAWDDYYDITVGPEARAALDAGVQALAGLGHGVEGHTWDPAPEYGDAFRTLWMAGASAVPVDDDATLDRMEPLTAWLVRRGREVPARELVAALRTLVAFERRLVAGFGDLDAVVTPALAMTPRPVGWFDPEDPDRNFVQQCQYTPFTSWLNVAGLPAITVPAHWTADGLPMGVQIIGRPGGEAALLAIAAQLEDVLRWPEKHPPVW